MADTEVLGDLNGDGIVNIQDVVLIAASFGTAGENGADLNGDGVVNVSTSTKRVWMMKIHLPVKVTYTLSVTHGVI